MHYDISTYLVLRFAKVYVDEIKQQQKRESMFCGAGWMGLLVDSEEGVTLKDGRKCLRFSLRLLCTYGYNRDTYMCIPLYSVLYRAP